MRTAASWSRCAGLSRTAVKHRGSKQKVGFKLEELENQQEAEAKE
jgi:hypothetical protein